MHLNSDIDNLLVFRTVGRLLLRNDWYACRYRPFRYSSVLMLSRMLNFRKLNFQLIDGNSRWVKDKVFVIYIVLFQHEKICLQHLPHYRKRLTPQPNFKIINSCYWKRMTRPAILSSSQEFLSQIIKCFVCEVSQFKHSKMKTNKWIYGLIRVFFTQVRPRENVRILQQGSPVY